jgi:maleylacetoacetate isomerase
MQLHGYFRSSAAFRVRIALNLKGIDYESVALNLRRNEHREPSFIDLNPQGFVPVLEDEGEVLSQSLAIIEYLDETHPNPPLLPGHPGDRARVRGLAQLLAGDIHPLITLRVMRYLRTPLGHDKVTVEAWCRHWIAEGLAACEAMLADDDRTGVFCQGDEPGLADICLVPQLVVAEDLALDLAAYPTLRRINAACLKLDAFARAHPSRQPDAE